MHPSTGELLSLVKFGPSDASPLSVTRTDPTLMQYQNWAEQAWVDPNQVWDDTMAAADGLLRAKLHQLEPTALPVIASPIEQVATQEKIPA